MPTKERYLKNKERLKLYNREYERNRRKKEGHKEYMKGIMERFKKKNPTYIKDYFKKYKNKNPFYLIEYHARYRKEHPLEERARRTKQYEIKSGKCERPEKCSLCNKIGKICGHHSDYSKPLDVVWLCGSCHRKLHYELKLKSN